MFTQMFQPNLYHGKTPWNRFEGWYFKLVDAKASKAVSLIPGVFWGKEKAHCFLQVLDSPAGQYTYHQFTPEDFSASHRPFQVKVQENRFSLQGISLSLFNQGQRIEGQLQFSSLIPWSSTFLSPGSMGFFNFLPFMECYSQVCAMHLDLSGELCIQNRIYDFNGGAGYIEKNWGSAFPRSWVWVQSNHFSQPGLSLSCSIGHIPFWVTYFTGFLAGLWIKDQLIPFTTMNRSSLTLHPHGGDMEIRLANRTHRLVLHTHTDPDSFLLCRGPEKTGAMNPLVQESLTGRVALSLYDQASGKLILEDEGRAAGIEYGGQWQELLHPSLSS